MPKCDWKQPSTTHTPLDKRERHPHRSGQECEHGETPETGRGGGERSQFARDEKDPAPTSGRRAHDDDNHE